MRYIVIVILILLFSTTVGFCQRKQEKGSQYKSIRKRKIDVDQSIPRLIADAQALIDNDIEMALDKVERALALSIAQKNTFFEAKSYLLLGLINQKIMEWELAIENYKNAFQRFHRNFRKDPAYLQSIEGLALSYTQLEQYDEAIRYHELRLKQSEQPQDVANVNLDLAEIYSLQNNLKSAEKYLKMGDSLINLYNISTLISKSQSINAILLARNDQPEEAEEYLVQSQQNILNSSDSLQGISLDKLDYPKEEVIKAYGRSSRGDKEVDIRNKSIALNLRLGNSVAVIKEKQLLSKAFITSGNSYAAIGELEDAVNLADSLQNNEELVNAYEALADAWNQTGDQLKAISTYQKLVIANKNAKFDAIAKDSLKSEILRKQQDILSLTKELALDESEYLLDSTNSKLQLSRYKIQSIVIYGLLLLLLVSLIGAWLIYRNAKKSKERGQLLSLKSLRSQMNPHFIFNALNSVNQYIALNDERSANKFLSQFSKLMRLVLDNSQQDFISLQEEHEILALYLQLEHNRFRDKFDYELIIDQGLSTDSLMVPPMLIQPYIENAIWHGLRYKEEKGLLTVKISQESKLLLVEVTDNGIGRKKSLSLKTKHQKEHSSTGMKNTKDRLQIINEIYHKGYAVTITDLNENYGTKVCITLPQHLIEPS